MKMNPVELNRRLTAIADDWEAQAAALAGPLDDLGPTKATKIRAIAGGFRLLAAQQLQPFVSARRRVA
jgi:hypothetical protein